MGILGALVDVLICHQEADATRARELILLIDECRQRGIDIQIVAPGSEAETEKDTPARLLLRQMPSIDLRKELKLLAAYSILPRTVTVRQQNPRQDTAGTILRRNIGIPRPRFMFRSRGGKM